MIQKIVVKKNLDENNSIIDDLKFWLSKSPEERVSTVEYLRRQYHGSSARFKELLKLFNAHKVEYVIVGDYALAFHGSPRYTGDIDVLVKPDEENAQRVLGALEEFGFGSIGIEKSDFMYQNKVVQLGVPPVRIDIITSISGVSLDETFAGALEGKYGDIPVSYIGRDQFIKNKRAIGRQKDLSDLEALGEE